MARRKDGSDATEAVAEERSPDASPSPRSSRLRRFRRLALELGVLVLVFFALGSWQTRGLLPRGEPIPEFDLVDLEGKRVALTDYRGKTLLVHFWATWCGVCRQEFGALNALYQNLGPDEALVSVVADADDRDRLAGFVREHQLEYPILLGTDEVLKSFKIEAFPTNYYVNGAGMLRDKTVGLSTRMTMGARMACAK